MDKNVMLTISGLHQMADTDEGTVDTVAEAEYFKRGDSHYLVYEEVDEELKQSTKCRLKLKGKCVELVKQGLLAAHMIFEEGKKHMTLYRTPFGEIPLGVDTRFVEVTEEENRMKVQIGYRLEAYGEMMSDCELSITVESR